MIWLGLVVLLAALVLCNRIAGKTYVGKLMLAFDYFVSVLWSRDFDLTISSQCGLYWRRGNPPAFWFVLHRVLNGIQQDHCEQALEHDEKRARGAIAAIEGKP